MLWGDPIGPSLFALSVDEATQGIQSDVNMKYLDDATLGNFPERVHDDLVVLLERLIEKAWRSMVTIESSPFSLTACRRLCSEDSYQGLGGLKRVTFHCWEPRWICNAFRELYVRRGKRLRE